MPYFSFPFHPKEGHQFIHHNATSVSARPFSPKPVHTYFGVDRKPLWSTMYKPSYESPFTSFIPEHRSILNSIISPKPKAGYS